MSGSPSRQAGTSAAASALPMETTKEVTAMYQPVEAIPMTIPESKPPTTRASASEPQTAIPVEAPPQQAPKPRSVPETPESTEGRPNRSRFSLGSFRAAFSRGSTDHSQNNRGHPIGERSISLSTDDEKKRGPAVIWSLAAFRAKLRLRTRGKEKAEGLPSPPEEHSANVGDATEVTASPPLLPENIEPGPEHRKDLSTAAVELTLAVGLQPPTSLYQPSVSQENPDQGVSTAGSKNMDATPFRKVSINTTEIKQETGPETPQVVVNDGKSPPISRSMPAHEVVSHLVKHGCEDLTDRIDASTFGEHPIAIGGLSDIYRGKLKDGRAVAVKALRIAAQQSMGESSGHLRRAARELHTWSRCKHSNVLELFGLATFRDRIGMVSPWMSKGTLPEFLAANPNANRRDLCVQICEGLSHMHSAGIIHGDLKGANVLVCDDEVAVLADFGSSTLKDQSLKFTQAASGKALTVRWSAPELVTASDCQHTKASDVFALAMTIYEVLTGKVPYYEIKDVAPVIIRIMQRHTPTRPIPTPAGHASDAKLWDLFTHCWKYAPAERPSAIEAMEKMKAIPLEGVVYQFPQQSTPDHELQTRDDTKAANPTTGEPSHRMSVPTNLSD